MNRLNKILSVTLIFLAFSCKSAKTVSRSGSVESDITSKQLIKAHTKQDVSFKTLQSKVKVEYTQDNKSQSHSINLRMEKDKTIWLSATLGIVRAKITPEKVSFYNKLDKTYFDGDFTLISDLLGTDLDFNNLQNLLLGQALYDLKHKDYETNQHETSYMLTPEQQNRLFEIIFLLNPSHFKMDSQQLAQPLERRFLQIDYKDYQEVEKQIIPQNIKVYAVENDTETIIDMELKSVSLNQELRFPFRIPSGFDEIVIE